MEIKKILLVVCAMVSLHGMDEQNISDEKFNAPNDQLDWAVRFGFVEDAEAALKAGANPNLCHNGYQYPLSRAIFRRNLEIIELLLKYKADVNKNAQNTSNLWEAVNSSSIAEVLIKNGADVNFVFSEDDYIHLQRKSLLWAGVADRKGDFVKLLIAANCNVDFIYDNGDRKESVLDLACIYNAVAEAVVGGKMDKAKKIMIDCYPGQHLSELVIDQSLAAQAEKPDAVYKQMADLKKIMGLLIARGAPILHSERDHEILKPMVLPYVMAIVKNTCLFNPLARLVVEYIYNVNVNLEGLGHEKNTVNRCTIL